MKCPLDESPLVMTERSGIEIDYCPSCRGVWLDRGELDKIIDRSFTDETPSPRRQEEFSKNNREGHDSTPAGYNNNHHGASRSTSHHDQPRRRESWLSNLFD